MKRMTVFAALCCMSWLPASYACSLGNYKPVEKAKLAVAARLIAVRNITGKVVSGHDFFENPHDYDGGGRCPERIYDYVELSFQKMVRFEWLTCVAMVKVVTAVNAPLPSTEKERTLLSTSCIAK